MHGQQLGKKQTNKSNIPSQAPNPEVTLTPSYRITTVLTSNNTGQFCRACILYKWNHIVYSILSRFFGPILNWWDVPISLGLVLLCLCVHSYYVDRVEFICSTADGCLHRFLLPGSSCPCCLVCIGDFDRATPTWKKNGGVAFWHSCVKFVKLKCEIPIFCLEYCIKETFLIYILSLTLPSSSTLSYPLPSCLVQEAKIGKK